MLRSRLFLAVAVVLMLVGLAASAWRMADRRAPESVTYIEQRHPNLIIHQPAGYPTEKMTALVQAVRAAIGRQVGFHRLDQAETLELWLLPKGAALPEGLAQPPVPQAVWSGGPFTLVARIDALQQLTGVDDAVAIAISQPADSPAYKSAWLYTGMAAVWQADPETFPARLYRGADGRVPKAAELLPRLLAHTAAPTANTAYTSWREAAGVLAAFVVDRLGIDWPRHFSPSDLSPEGMLNWTAGAGKAESLERWQRRMESSPTDLKDFSTLADLSPVRAVPALAALPVGPGPNANASPHRYTITARYEPSRREVSGRLELTWQNGEGIPLGELWFNLWANAEQYAKYGAHLNVRQTLIDGQPAAFTARGMDLRVPLGGQLRPGETATVVVEFATRLPALITDRVLGQEGEKRFNLAHWYPQLAVLDDRGWNLHPLPYFPGEPYHETADYLVTLDVPPGTQLAATGHLEQLEKGSDRWLYRYDAPRVRDWAATGGRGLTERTVQVGQVQVHVIDTDSSWVSAAAEKTKRVLPFYEERFGRYPYADLVVSCCAGMEYPGLSYGIAGDPQVSNWSHTLHHELAHQWFYGLVGNDQWSEAWLDEAFARYADRTAADAFSIPWRSNPFKMPPDLRTSSSTSAYLTQTSAYGAGIQRLGADTLQALEKQLGAAVFDRLLKEWVARYRFKTATTADFLRLADEVSGVSLRKFFSEHGIEPNDRGPYQPQIPWPGALHVPPA